MPGNSDKYFEGLRHIAEQRSEDAKQDIDLRDQSTLIHELKVHQIELEMQNDELRTTQLKLQDAMDELALLYHQSPVGYLTLTQSGLIVEANDSFSRMINQPIDKLRRSNFAALLTEATQPIFRHRFKAFFKAPIGKTIEVCLAADREEPHYIEIQGYHLPKKSAKAEQLLAMNVIDISAKRSIENSLFLAENVIGVMPDGVLITDADGHIINVNPALSAQTGYSSRELIGQPASLLRSKRSNNVNFQTILNSLGNQEVWQGRLWNKRKDGSEFYSEISMTAVYKSATDQQPLYYLQIVRDITRQTRLEQQLQQTQKMESLGTMVGGLAHNFNNLLAGIKGNLFLLKRDSGISEKSKERCDNIDALSEQAADLLKQLISFAREKQEDQSTIDLGEIVNSVVHLHRATIPDNIALDVTVPNQQMMISGNQNQMMQVLLNMLINAVHALKNSVNPRISIHLERASWASCGPTIKNGPVALLKIIDNGCGIEVANLDKIFDPFFTTKDVGEGSGLGLSMVYGTIKNMGGDISVASDSTNGTIFSICFPLTEGSISPVACDESRPIQNGQGEKVLIVDDNSEVRNTLRDIFKALNYQPITAENGHQAMKMLLEDAEIKLLLTDAIMPETGGLELIESLRKLGNKIPAILLTANTEILSNEIKDYDCQLLRKPFDIVSLSNRIRIMLEDK